MEEFCETCPPDPPSWELVVFPDLFPHNEQLKHATLTLAKNRQKLISEKWFFCFMDAQPLAQKTIKIPLAKNRHFLTIWKGGKVRADYFRYLEDVFTFFCCWAGENMQLVIVWKHHVRDILLWKLHNYKARNDFTGFPNRKLQNSL